MEEWRPVVGYEGTYEVSSQGRIRRGSRELLGTDSNGYRKVALSVNEVKTFDVVHRVVAKAFLPNPDNLPLVRHLNDVRNDNRVENLAWGTQSDNMHDAVKNGRNHEALKTRCKQGHKFDKVERGQRVCLTCRGASRAKSLEKARNTVLDPDSPVHGTRYGYNSFECRCEPCRNANATHQKQIREKRKSK